MYQNQIFHQRIEYAFSDLLGDIGGTVELLVKISIFIFGGYLSFRSDIIIMFDLYSGSAHQKEKLKDEHHHHLNSVHPQGNTSENIKDVQHEGGSVEPCSKDDLP